MEEVSKNELEEYLKTVLDLEYRIFNNTLIKDKLGKVHKPYASLGDENAKDKRVKSKKDRTINLIGIIINSFVSLRFFISFFSGEGGIVLALLFLVFAFINYGFYQAANVEVDEYSDKAVKQRKTDHNRAYNKELALYSKAQKAIHTIEQNNIVLKKHLRIAYDENIIFEKYRNLAAIASIYEYITSGRCNELAGTNGAYNLYEQELKQNIIINDLENMMINLESIKNSQYVLYNELSKTNVLLSNILSIEQIDLFIKTLES